MSDSESWSEPLGPSSLHNAPMRVPACKKKTIEQIYQKKTQLEHILLRPDTYIGSVEKQSQSLWVHDGRAMVQKTVGVVPGLFKIFDEILVNAADNKARDPRMDCVRVAVDVEDNRIQVWNNGEGIPVEVHKEEGVYVPELIFGHLLTSSNYDDKELKVVGGRNGYGAKLANIFSTEFIIETCDGHRRKHYRQRFSANMSAKEAPIIKSCKASEKWTSVTFRPDLQKFGMACLEEETVALMRKRVYDIAGVLGKTVKVYFNDDRIPVRSFDDYVDMFLGPKDEGAPRVSQKINDRWEVCISTSEGQFQQVSFVNAISTSKGGTHVNHVVDQITKTITEKVKKKNKNASVKPFMVKNHLWVFVNCLIENPAFDSQTKELMTSKVSSFGSKCELPGPFIDKVAKSGVLDSVLSYANYREAKELKKTDGSKRSRITGIPKLDDANDAGTRNSDRCTLILTEGDSAKTLAISGLSVVGRDSYGVFPLRGKLLNVRDANMTSVTNNAEISNIKKILGLQHGKKYHDTNGLRYGHLMIMTDQDHDGSHIKGLIMNFIHHFYPSLLRMPGFLQEFITPIIQATKGSQTMTFYTIPEYETWKETLGGSTKGWKVKYYKGLGTSTSKQAKEYFAALDENRKDFLWTGDEDDAAIEMAFSKKKVEERKQWLQGYQPGTYLDHSQPEIGYSDFIHKELILFSRADLERSIPSMVDGLKPGQRKILYCCFKRNLQNDIKVAQLSGYVSEHSAYHHGEQSLHMTIIGLAQDFVGSNNINLLVPSGQFGTRLQGGKDSASPRYIFTRMSKLTRHLFNEDDDKLLKYQNEEGQIIEPEWYMPILPTVLVNGAEGIGTGWSTYIPNYSPREIVHNLKLLLQGQAPVPMIPWYKGFKGSMEETASKTLGKTYINGGIISEITELPIRKWTQDYKEFLEGLTKPAEGHSSALLTDYKEHHTDTTVHFRLSLTEHNLRQAHAEGLHNTFKLTSKISTGNMMLFDPSGKIKRYESPELVLMEFFEMRIKFYGNRQKFLLKMADADLLRINNKVRFILAVVEGDLVINNRKKKDIETYLDHHGYDRLPKSSRKVRHAEELDEGEEGEDGHTGDANNFDYLLSMAISSLTMEKVEALKAEALEQAARVNKLRNTTPEEMWNADLDNFLEALEVVEAEELAAQELLAQQQCRAGNKGRKVLKKPRPLAKPRPTASAAATSVGTSALGSRYKQPPNLPTASAAEKSKAKARVTTAAGKKAGPTTASITTAPVSMSIDITEASKGRKAQRRTSEEDYQPTFSERIQGRLQQMTLDTEQPTRERTGRAASQAASRRMAATIEISDEDEESEDKEDEFLPSSESDGEPEVRSPLPPTLHFSGRSMPTTQPSVDVEMIDVEETKQKLPASKPGRSKETKQKLPVSKPGGSKPKVMAPAQPPVSTNTAADGGTVRKRKQKAAASTHGASVSKGTTNGSAASQRGNATKGKRKTKVVLESEEEDDSPEEQAHDLYTFDLVSPEPKGKVRKMRPSPFHKKSGLPKDVQNLDPDVSAIGGPSRPRRTTAKVTYIISSDSENDSASAEDKDCSYSDSG